MWLFHSLSYNNFINNKSKLFLYKNERRYNIKYFRSFNFDNNICYAAYFFEIIEINCLNISYNTKKNIDIRAKYRSDSYIYDSNDNTSIGYNKNDDEQTVEFTNKYNK